jgi:uncharacterized protein
MPAGWKLYNQPMYILPYEQIPDLPELAQKAHKQTQTFFKNLRKKMPDSLPQSLAELHETFFESFDCLQCANCCKGLGPLLLETDIDRVAKYLKIKSKDFISKYLRIDEDRDFVFREMPCPFLCPDNYCSVYDARPKACREYPHTDHKRFNKILDITLKNTYTCPAVYSIVEELKKRYADK